MIHHFFKQIFYYGMAIMFCIIGTVSIYFYIVKPFSLLSVFIGIGGGILIEPAITAYATKINDFFENE